MSKKYTLEDMINLATERGGICHASNYKNVDKLVKWECSLGHKWYASFSNIKGFKSKKGTWCPECAGKRQKIEDFKEIAAENGGKCLSKRYKTNQVKLKWQCKCGYIWWATPANIKGNKNKKGTWCPKCSREKATLKNRGKRKGPRKSGEEIDNEIRKIFNGKVWMKNPQRYRGMKYKQKFIDNRYDEKVEFIREVALVYHRGFGAPKYHKKRLSEGSTKYTKSTLKKMASKFKSKKDFRKKFPSAYIAASRFGIVEEICSHMEPLGNRKNRFVYAIKSDKTNEIYIGLSYDPKKRFENHKKFGKEWVKKLIRNGGVLVLLSDRIPVEKASKLEKDFVKKYFNKGWKLINRSVPGTIGGSNLKWTKQKIVNAAFNCKTVSEFLKKHKSAYMAAKRYGCFEEVTKHMEKPKRWDESTIKVAMRKSDSRTDFARKFPGAYAASKRLKIFEKLVSQYF